MCWMDDQDLRAWCGGVGDGFTIEQGRGFLFLDAVAMGFLALLFIACSGKGRERV